MTSTSQPNPEKPTRLIAHFRNRSPTGQSSGWKELWESGQNDLWDRGKPSPALVNFVEQRPEVLPKNEHRRRLKALVPGCGRGYDVVMLALHGFDAYGLEVSQTAVSTAESYSKHQQDNVSPENFSNPGSRPSIQPGRVQFLLGDFFANEWESQCLKEASEGFDLIYDYTFLCALPPSLRKDWSRRMQSLLAPSGILVCLEFPLHKHLEAEGPPWGLKGVYWNLLAEGGDGYVKDLNEDVNDCSTTDNGHFTRVLHYKPECSYSIGKGTDMMSVWTAK